LRSFRLTGNFFYIPLKATGADLFPRDFPNIRYYLPQKHSSRLVNTTVNDVSFHGEIRIGMAITSTSSEVWIIPWDLNMILSD
jgi:hypothetical protein